MDVNAIKQINSQPSYNPLSDSKLSKTDLNTKTTEVDKSEQGSSADAKEKDKGKKPLSKMEVSELTYEMNKFLEMINSNIQFAIHEKTNRLMVRVVDTRENKVLKEFPPHEMLDTIAKIRDFVGFLLDKKA